MDVGKYNLDSERYQHLIEEMYETYPPITLSPEYAHFIQDNLLRFLIRLARYKFIARLIKDTDDVLEVGAGSGLGTIFLGQHAAKVTGLDIKQYELDEARAINRRENVTFLLQDFFTYDPQHKHDVIVALDVIEHMSTEDGHRLIAAMARHLKLNGMAVLGTPSIYSYEYQSPLSKASHVKCYDQQELVSLVENSFGRTLAFSMNDELVHTGFPKMAWYYFVLGFVPQSDVGG
jgi:2-polyprenyl-3-methyl-5-hydroxy-6-metoxy-1,4-benzoquinol methylase